MKIFFRYLVFFILMFVMICAGFVCIIAASMAGFMIYARLRDGHLEAHDWRILRIDAEIALAAGLTAFCGQFGEAAVSGSRRRRAGPARRGAATDGGAGPPGA